MQVLTTIADVRHVRRGAPEPLGLVPTMGFLHQGHLSLVHRARTENASVLVSIFVNPTQFGPGEDLDSYPRDLDRDLGLLIQAGADLAFVPDAAEIYPADFQTRVSVDDLSRPLEGARRPGHFQGVATVVAKLFNIVAPQRAYFGQKDAQQVRVIQQMTADLNFPVEIVVCPIVREADGLAMSSRNIYLTPEQRAAAPVLYRGLKTAGILYDGGERDASVLRQAILSLLASEPLAQVEYVSVADATSLDELERLNGPALVSMAVRIGRARLIDNLVMG